MSSAKGAQPRLRESTARVRLRGPVLVVVANGPRCLHQFLDDLSDLDDLPITTATSRI